MKKLIAIFLSLIVLPAFAAPTDNIFVDRNGNVQPYAALCTTHAYNIGATTNSSAIRAKMDNVVKLKTNLITLEMKRQYDFLESTIRRLETQLQKAILVAKLEAAGAAPPTTGGGSGGGTSGPTHRGLPDAENCGVVPGGSTEILNCIRRNIDRVDKAIVGGNVGQAYRQLSDYDVILLEQYANRDDKNRFFDTTVKESPASACKPLKNSRDDIQKCTTVMRNAVVRAIEFIEQQNRQGSRQF